MRTLDAAREVRPSCLWHTLAAAVSSLPCSREQRPGHSCCAEHAAELDLQAFESAHAPDLAWVIYWAAGSRLMRRCSAGDVAELLLRRHPGVELELTKDRSALELRQQGRLVGLVRRLGWFE
jgi:hypothetical protein